MNRGLLGKTVRETWPALVLVGLGLMAFKALLAYIFPQFADQLGTTVMQFAFLRDIIRALLGAEIGDAVDPSSVGAFAWVHPVVLALLWAHEITFCTRVPAGEVDRATIDMLLGLPVSRWQLYFCETAVWLVWGLIIVACGWVGEILGGWTADARFRTPPARVLPIVANLFCMYLAVGGFSWLVSTLSDRRGRAVVTVFAVVVASFALSFLAQFWQPARDVSWLSLLNYYQPLVILRSDSWPWADMLALGLFGALCWGVAGVILSRRDIRTV